MSDAAGHLSWTPGHLRMARPACTFLPGGKGQEHKLSETTGHLGNSQGGSRGRQPSFGEHFQELPEPRGTPRSWHCSCRIIHPNEHLMAVTDQRQWYVVYSKSTREGSAQYHLAQKGLEVFFPQLQLPAPLPAHRATVPLFPNYLLMPKDGSDSL